MYNSDLPAREELPSTAQLVRSTFIAILTAAVLLVTIVLPAEYGVDPSGLGNVLGLKKMGEIKVSLEQEAEADKAVPAAVQPKVQALAAAEIAVKTKAEPAASTEFEASHQKSISLKPGEGAEWKLSMKKDAEVIYQWSSTGGLVNFDTHGDSSTLDYYGYGKGRQVAGDNGVLIAAFDGNHGWFWRNRSDKVVTITLNTRGNYQSIEEKL